MNDQQQRFVECYIETGGNATQAAIKAKYSRSSAKQIAYALMHKPEVQSAIRDALKGIFTTYAVAAYQKLHSLMLGSADEKVALQCAQILINSTGFRVAEKVDIQVTDQRSDEELKAFITANVPQLGYRIIEGTEH